MTSDYDQTFSNNIIRKKRQISLVVQWMRVHLPRQGTGVWSLVQEICTCCRDWSRNSTTEPACPWVCAPRQKKPSQWEARTRDQRGARPRCTTRESLCAATKTQCSQNNNNNFLKRNKGKKKNQITCQQIMKAQQKIMIQNLSGNNTKWG